LDLVVVGVVAGVLGTLVMDSLNHLFARTGMLLKIDMRMIGRMSMGWVALALPLSQSKRNETGRKRDALRLCHALHHRRGPCGPVRARLGSLGRRDCITGMDACLWRRNNGSLSILRLPFHVAGSVWLAVSRRY